jgi:hypothetical protein
MYASTTDDSPGIYKAVAQNTAVQFVVVVVVVVSFIIWLGT